MREEWAEGGIQGGMVFQRKWGEWRGGKEEVREGITKGGMNGWRDGGRVFQRQGGREGEREGERGRLLQREGGREEGRVLQRVGWMGGRMKIGMERITKGVGRQAEYYKWRYGGREGGRGGGEYYQ